MNKSNNRNRKKNKLKILNIIILLIIAIFGVLFLTKKINFNIKKEQVDNFNPALYINKIFKIAFDETPKEIKYHTSLIMAGDALIHSAVYDDAKTSKGYDFTPMLELIKPIVKKHDLAYYNQETILGGTELGLSTYPCFNSPYSVGDAFLDAGFNIVSLANNHTLDRGEAAIINSRKYWNKKNVLINGSATSQKERDTIEIKEKNNIKYTMLSYTTTTNGIPRQKNYHVNVYDKKQVKKDIEKVRGKSDIILVAMHWGIEYNQGITSEQREIAKYLSNLGVDIIIGAHPHVIEPIEYINNTLVIYSLGNFISAQRGVDKTTGLMVSVNIDKIVTPDKTTTTVSAPTAELVYTHSNYDPRSNFKIYPYTKLTNEILPNYKQYYKNQMGIVTSKSKKVIPVKLKEG